MCLSVPEGHLDRFFRSVGLMVVTNDQTDRPRYAKTSVATGRI